MIDTEIQKKKKSLRFSFLDGIFASGMTGFTQDYLIPFLLFLGGSAREVGILSSIPNIIASLIQLKTSDLIGFFKSRKRTITLFVFMQALATAGIGLTIFMKSHSVYLFIILVVLFASFGSVSTPAWGSLMSDLVPEDRRGAYFGWRNSILGIIVAFSSVSAGLMLNNIKKEYLAYGFLLIFSLAFICRFISWNFLRKMYDPKTKQNLNVNVSIKSFISNFRSSSFAKFALFVALLTFSVNIASPYFSVLMIRDLHFTYLQYSLVIITATLMTCLMMKRWGKLADVIGNVRVLKFTAPIITLIPLFWLINRNPFYLMGIQLISGFAWAGFNLSASNYIYDAVVPGNRVRYIAYFNVFNGLMLSAGALSGGFLVRYLPAILGYRILTLLIISSVLRIIVVFIFSFKLKEVRIVRKVSSNQLFTSIIGIKPLIGIERKTIR